jgi:pimeloyl-ACP methyl ester carboxylesterase
MGSTNTIHVPHLRGIDASYRMDRPYDSNKPTCILVNSFTMTSALYDAQFENQTLLDAMNLVAVEPLGHGQTRAQHTDTFTYWDTAIMNLQVLDALEIKGKVFALGTSQGGWIVVRMALLRPDRLAGILPLGTSMDYESDRTRKLGNFNALETLTDPIKELSSKDPTPDFVIREEFRKFPIYCGFGQDVDQQTVEFWNKEMMRNYSGDDGRRRLRECCINLRDRDGLHARLFDVQCPVLWIHGSKDAAYSVANAEEEIRMFVRAPEARLQVVEGGQHYLSASHPEVVDEALMRFVEKLM